MDHLSITPDDGVDLKAVFSDSAKRLAMVTDARIEFLGRGDLEIWETREALTFLTSLGFDATPGWLSSLLTRGKMDPRRIGGHPVFSDSQVADLLHECHRLKRWLPGCLMTLKSAKEIEDDERECAHMVEMIEFLATHTYEELAYRFEQAGDDKTRTLIRASQLMKRGAFDALIDEGAASECDDTAATCG